MGIIVEIAKRFLSKNNRRRLQRLDPRNYIFMPQPITYNQDMLVTRHNCDFMQNPLFMEAYNIGKSMGGWGSEIHWRVHVACWAAWHAKQLDGDFVECGVNRGGLASAVMHFVGFQDLPKKFFLLDTFSGLVEEQITEDEQQLGVFENKIGKYSECFDFVKKQFERFNNVEIICGPIPETLPQVTSSRIAYLSIDMNCMMPEIAAAEYFWEKLVCGAVMVLDDYAYGTKLHVVQKRGFDDFAAKRSVKVLTLPTGQGLIVKP